MAWLVAYARLDVAASTTSTSEHVHVSAQCQTLRRACISADSCHCSHLHWPRLVSMQAKALLQKLDVIVTSPDVAFLHTRHLRSTCDLASHCAVPIVHRMYVDRTPSQDRPHFTSALVAFPRPIMCPHNHVLPAPPHSHTPALHRPPRPAPRHVPHLRTELSLRVF